MATVVQIHTPACGNCPGLTLQLDLGNVQINQPTAGMEQLWAMPNYDNSPPVDLCRAGVGIAGRGP